MSGAANLAYGSNSEILAKSRSFSLWSRNRTQDGHRAMSKLCQFHTSPRHSIPASTRACWPACSASCPRIHTFADIHLAMTGVVPHIVILGTKIAGLSRDRLSPADPLNRKSLISLQPLWFYHAFAPSSNTARVKPSSIACAAPWPTCGTSGGQHHQGASSDRSTSMARALDRELPQRNVRRAATVFQYGIVPAGISAAGAFRSPGASTIPRTPDW